MSTKQEMLLMAMAVKQGLLRKEQVQECMDLQAAVKEARGVDMPLVQIAVKKQYLTPEQAHNLGATTPAPASGGHAVSVEEASRIPIFDIERVIGQGGMAQ